MARTRAGPASSRSAPDGTRERSLPSRAVTARDEVHRDLGRRSRGRAEAHLRRTSPSAPRRPSARHRRDRAGSRGVGVRRRAVQPGRHERRRGTSEVGEHRAVPLRRDASWLLRTRRPGARHGHQRRVGRRQLPFDDLGVLRSGVLQRQGPRTRSGMRASVERLDPRGVASRAPHPLHSPRHRLSDRARDRGCRDPPKCRTRASPR